MKKVSLIALLLIMSSGPALSAQLDVVNDVISPFFKDVHTSMRESHPDHPHIGVRSNSELHLESLNVHDREETPDAYKYGESELFAYSHGPVRQKSFMDKVWEQGDIAKRRAMNELEKAIKKISKLINRSNEPEVGAAMGDKKIPKSTIGLALGQNNLDKFVAIAPFTPTELILSLIHI